MSVGRRCKRFSGEHYVTSRSRTGPRSIATRSTSETECGSAAIGHLRRSEGGPQRYLEWSRSARLRDLLPLLPYVARGRNTLDEGGQSRNLRDDSANSPMRYAILMNSGTAALHSAYVAVGIKPGDEVLVPTYTWFATATPILQCGATPVFCDIDPITLTMDPIDAERRITPRTRAICVVHIWGNPAALDQFVALAKRFDLVRLKMPRMPTGPNTKIVQSVPGATSAVSVCRAVKLSAAERRELQLPAIQNTTIACSLWD